MPELGKQIKSGGDSGGRYVFADLAEVDAIIAALKSMSQELALDGRDLRAAIGEAVRPADDGMSRGQARKYRDSLWIAYQHNLMMSTYVDDQAIKLSAARNAYVDADSAVESRLSGVSGADQ